MVTEFFYIALGYFGAATFFIERIMVTYKLQFKLLKKVLLVISILLLLVGWMGIVTLRVDVFSLSFYPILTLSTIAYAAIGTTLAFRFGSKKCEDSKE